MKSLMQSGLVTKRTLYERLLDDEDNLVSGMENDLYAFKVKEWADKVGLVKDNSDVLYTGYNTYHIVNNTIQIGKWVTWGKENNAHTLNELLPSDINIKLIQELAIADISCKNTRGAVRISTQKDIDILSKIHIDNLALHYNCNISKLDFSKLDVDRFQLRLGDTTSISSLPRHSMSIICAPRHVISDPQKNIISIDLRNIKGIQSNILKVGDTFSINGIQICSRPDGTKLMSDDNVTRELDKFISDNNIRDFVITGVNKHGVYTLYMFKRLKNKYALKKI